MPCRPVPSLGCSRRQRQHKALHPVHGPRTRAHHLTSHFSKKPLARPSFYSAQLHGLNSVGLPGTCTPMTRPTSRQRHESFSGESLCPNQVCHLLPYPPLTPFYWQVRHGGDEAVSKAGALWQQGCRYGRTTRR